MIGSLLEDKQDHGHVAALPFGLGEADKPINDLVGALFDLYLFQLLEYEVDLGGNRSTISMLLSALKSPSVPITRNSSVSQLRSNTVESGTHDR